VRGLYPRERGFFSVFFGRRSLGFSPLVFPPQDDCRKIYFVILFLLPFPFPLVSLEGDALSFIHALGDKFSPPVYIRAFLLTSSFLVSFLPASGEGIRRVTNSFPWRVLPGHLSSQSKIVTLRTSLTRLPNADFFFSNCT